MSNDLLKDPEFRHQYDVAPRPDREFEQALYEIDYTRVHLIPVTAPLTIIQPWLAPLHK